MDSTTLKTVIERERRCQICLSRCDKGALLVMSLSPYSSSSLYICVICFKELAERFTRIELVYGTDDLKAIPCITVV